MTTDKIEIAAVDVRDFKRLRDVKIDTEADRHLLLIAGRNSNGKSSLLDAITCTLGGEKHVPTKPVHEGADKARSVIELQSASGRRYTVTRTFAGEGTNRRTTLKVVGPDGPMAKAQTWLDDVIGDRFLDPSAFISAKPPEQRRTLLQVAGIDVDGLDADRDRAFKARTDENRALKAAETRRAGIQPMTDAPDGARTIDQIQADLDQVDEQVRAAEAAAREAARITAELARHLEEQAKRRARREELARQLAALDAEIAAGDERTKRGEAAEAAAVEKTTTGEALGELQARRTALRAEQQRSQAAAVWRAQKLERDRQIAAADTEVAARQAAADRLTTEIKAIDEMKAAMLSGADFPVPGLAVTDEGITLDGIPFADAGQAAQVRVAIALAVRQSPRLRDVWIRLGALFDDQAIEAMRVVAAELDCRIWLEVVGEKNHGERAIVIRDGRVLGAGEAA
jgi:DNA repair exonuclease SbcCD ATPase subunit